MSELTQGQGLEAIETYKNVNVAMIPSAGYAFNTPQTPVGLKGPNAPPYPWMIDPDYTPDFYKQDRAAKEVQPTIPKLVERGLSVCELQDLFTLGDDGTLFWKIKPRRGVQVGDEAGSINNCGYHQIKFRGKIYKAHRLVFALVHEFYPADEIDHINHDRMDNHPTNLREATRAENRRNCAAYSGRVLKGVRLSLSKKHPHLRKPWMAQIRETGKKVTLGYFHSPLEAALAYDRSARITFGEFARTSFPHSTALSTAHAILMREMSALDARVREELASGTRTLKPFAVPPEGMVFPKEHGRIILPGEVVVQGALGLTKDDLDS